MAEYNPDKHRRAASARTKGAGGKMPAGMVYLPPEGDKGGYVLDTRAEAEHIARQGGARQHMTGLAGQYVKGAPFVGQYVDEAIGYMDEAAGGTPDLMRERARAAQERFEIDHPNQALAASITGGVLTSAPAVGPLSRVMSARSPAANVAIGAGVGGALGAAEGGVSGYGSGRSPEERRANAESGALVGGAVGGIAGGAAPLLFGGGQAAARNLASGVDKRTAAEVGGSPESAELVARNLRYDDPAEAARNIRQGGDDAMLADAGPVTQGLLDATIQAAGPGGAVAKKNIGARTDRAAQNIDMAINDAFGAPPAPVAREGSSKYRTLYDSAYKRPIDYSSDNGVELESLLKNVPGSALAYANELMQVRGEVSRQIKLTVDASGNVTGMQGLPDVRQWDYITRALNDVAKGGDGKGVLGGNTTRGAAYASLSRSIRKRLKSAVPEWKTAVDAVANDVSLKEARELGAVALRDITSRDELRESLADMGLAERKKMAAGVRQYIDDTLSSVKRTMTDSRTDWREAQKLLTMLSSRQAKDKLKMLLGEGQAKTLTGRLARAEKAFELKAATARNSATFARGSFMDTVKDMVDPGVMGKLAQGEVGPASKRIIQEMTAMTPARRREVEERIAGEIASILTTHRGPDAVVAAQKLTAMLARQPETERLAGLVGRAVAGGASLTGYTAGTQALE